MKKILMIMFLLIMGGVFAQQKQKWDYPIKPGMNEWKSYKNNAEKVQACQIPENILLTLKTKELLIICLDYPLLPDIFVFNNIIDGFNKFENDFNGFRELLKRDDSGKELSLLYKKHNPETFEKHWTTFEKGAYVIRISFIELFISHLQITNKLTKAKKREFVVELLSKKEKKKKHPSWYKNIGLQTCYLAMINIIKSEKEEVIFIPDDKNITSFIYSGLLISPDVHNQIDQVVEQYLNNN